jgi:hypothetical protein
MRNESLLTRYDHSIKSFFLKSQSKTKKKDFFSKKKFYFLSQSTRIRAVQIRKQNLINDELRVFQLIVKFIQKSVFKLFWKNDLMTFVQFLRSIDSMKMFIVYKRKNQKMKLSDICVSNNFKFDDDASWKKNIMKKKKYIKNLTNQFAEFFIFKFFELTKKTRLKSEWIQKMQIKDELLKRKKKLFLKMLFNCEIALFWDFIEKDFVRFEISSSMKIRIVLHEAWQVFKFQVLKTLMKTIAEMIKNRIKDDVLKFCYESYRNSWFLVKKKEKEKYRLINVVLKMNRVIIRNANLFSAIDEFFEKCANCAIISLMNLFSEYDQLSLIEKCRDIIVFMTSFNLMKMKTIFMKTINFVIQFVWMMNKIIVDHVFHHAFLFVNDIKIKKSKTTYNNEFILFEIRRYVMKHIQ